MAAERYLNVAESESFTVFSAEPPMSQEEAMLAPSVQFFGSESPEWIPPMVVPSASGYNVCFQSLILGKSTADRTKTQIYAQQLATLIGAEIKS